MDEYNYDELNHIGVVYKDKFICSTWLHHHVPPFYKFSKPE
jgi:hypothetical protein